jgi:hypothetical protein
MFLIADLSALFSKVQFSESDFFTVKPFLANSSTLILKLLSFQIFSIIIFHLSILFFILTLDSHKDSFILIIATTLLITAVIASQIQGSISLFIITF